MTQSGPKPDRNPALRRAPDLILSNPLNCNRGQGQRMHSNRLKRREFITLLGGAAPLPGALNVRDERRDAADQAGIGSGPKRFAPTVPRRQAQ
jgi:hypothetical protein